MILTKEEQMIYKKRTSIENLFGRIKNYQIVQQYNIFYNVENTDTRINKILMNFMMDETLPFFFIFVFVLL